MSDLEEPKSGVSRRTVTKAMAWSVPAIALAVPAPAYAASPCVPVITFGSDACRCPGQSTEFAFTYFLSFCANVEGECPPVPGSAVTILALTQSTGQHEALTPLGADPFPLHVPDGTCSAVYGFGSTNSSINLLVTFSFNGEEHVQSITAPVQQCTDCAG